MALSDIINYYYSTMPALMTKANGFAEDWSWGGSPDNGAMLPKETTSPQLYFDIGEDENDADVNGVGNNEIQRVVEMSVYGYSKHTYPDSGLEFKNILVSFYEAKMIDDIVRAFANPYKVSHTTGFLNIEYTGTEEIDMSEADDRTCAVKCNFRLTYKQELGINEW